MLCFSPRVPGFGTSGLLVSPRVRFQYPQHLVSMFVIFVLFCDVLCCALSLPFRFRVLCLGPHPACDTAHTMTKIMFSKKVLAFQGYYNNNELD